MNAIEKQLMESQRDALVALFLGEEHRKGQHGIKTEEALYEYLLIDSLVAGEVQTSKVAQAIASIQQYIFQRILNMEPGHSDVLEPSQVKSWQQSDSQYAVWAAEQELQDYPENYLTPISRINKSHYFTHLENTLNQNCLAPTKVQDAVLAYLHEFEAVSNLYVLSGYIDQDDITTARYYFIGRTNVNPYRYYWRMLDLSQKPTDSAKITPNCWSDWASVDLPLSGGTVLEKTVRPVYYNNRLYVIWAERDPVAKKDPDDSNKSTTEYYYRLKFAYKRYDGSWSAPNNAEVKDDGAGKTISVDGIYINEGTESKTIHPTEIDSIAIVDFSGNGNIDDKGHSDNDGAGRLFMGLFKSHFVEEHNQENKPTISFGASFDSALISRTITKPNEKFMYAQFKETKKLQRAVYQKVYAVDSVTRDTSRDWNDAGVIENISDWESGGGHEVYVEKGFTLKVVSNLTNNFENKYTFNTTDDGKSKYYIEDPFEIVSDGGNYITGSKAFLSYRKDNSDDEMRQGTYVLYSDIDGGSGRSFLYYDIHIHDDGMLSWDGKSKTNRLDLSGKIISFHNEFISGDKVQPFFISHGQRYGYLQELTDYSKIAITKDYKHRIWLKDNINGGHSAINSDPNFRYTITAPSALSGSHAISLSDFPDKREMKYTFWHGIQGNQYKSKKWEKSIYSAKCFVVKLKYVNAQNFELPVLKERYDKALGNVQFLDFLKEENKKEEVDTDKVKEVEGKIKALEEEIKALEKENPKTQEEIKEFEEKKIKKQEAIKELEKEIYKNLPDNTRLNTTFVKELIKRANIGIESLLQCEVQDQKLEANFDEDKPPEPMDFYGANSLYFWELFFHLPFLVAYRFSAEQQYEHAQKWLHTIFNPSAQHDRDGAGCWNVRPLLREGNPAHVVAGSADPDAIAYAGPIHYQKAIFLTYVRNLVDQGDAFYRQLTRDGLTAARVRYGQAMSLLGPRPDVHLSGIWRDDKLTSIAESKNGALRKLEQDCNPQDLLSIPGTHHSTLRSVDNDRFVLPLNTQLLDYWNTLESRLYNLRHNLTLDGKPLSLPLYATPMNPQELLARRANSGTLASGGSSSVVNIPPYRFRALLPRAFSAVERLSHFGDTLLSALERQDRAAQEELQQSQLLELSSYVLTLQQQSIDSAQAGKAALESSRTAAEKRYENYKALCDQNISSAEQQAMDLQSAAQVAAITATGFQTASGCVSLAPNIFGMADGGMELGAPLGALAFASQMSGDAIDRNASRIGQSEQYRRRREEWEFQYKQAQSEMDAIDKQIATQDLQIQAAQTTLQQATAQQAKTQAMFTFLKTRFTQASLYQWIIGQVAALYYQAYDAVLSLCLGAEACWQYERGDFTTRFIQTAAWNDSYRGLLVGETLKLNLQQMEVAYLSRDERCLEITKTVSLKQLIGGQDKWQEALEILCGRSKSGSRKPPSNGVEVSNGSVSFQLTELMFDQDYPGHYLRQLVNVSISLPAVVGPYQNVRAILTQTSNALVLKPDTTLVTSLIKGTALQGDNLKTNQRASQQIALSTGINDSGLFVLNFGDERYLPFEGTGAVSNWTLSFPRHDKTDQKALLESLTDVIVCIRYTARDGGKTFGDAVAQAVAKKDPKPGKTARSTQKRRRVPLKRSSETAKSREQGLLLERGSKESEKLTFNVQRRK